MMPLTQAAQRVGHDATFLTCSEFADALRPFQVLPSGSEAEVLLAEAARRTGGGSAVTNPTPANVAEFFVGMRVDLSMDQALPTAHAYAPDLILVESANFNHKHRIELLPPR